MKKKDFLKELTEVGFIHLSKIGKTVTKFSIPRNNKDAMDALLLTKSYEVDGEFIKKTGTTIPQSARQEAMKEQETTGNQQLTTGTTQLNTGNSPFSKEETELFQRLLKKYPFDLEQFLLPNPYIVKNHDWIEVKIESIDQLDDILFDFEKYVEKLEAENEKLEAENEKLK